MVLSSTYTGRVFLYFVFNFYLLFFQGPEEAKGRTSLGATVRMAEWLAFALSTR